MKNQEIDVLITPSSAFPALNHNIIHKLNPEMIYSYLFNALDFPAGIVPI